MPFLTGPVIRSMPLLSRYSDRSYGLVVLHKSVLYPESFVESCSFDFPKIQSYTETL